MAADRFPPVILAVSILPNPAEVGQQLTVRVQATDSARVILPGGAFARLRDGKRLAVRRDSMATEYELACTGAELDQAVVNVSSCVEALDGLAELLEQVVGVPST